MVKSNLIINKKFFRFNYQVQYTVEVALADNYISLLADAILNSLLPDEFFSNGIIKNLKGHNYLTTYNPSETEEILFITGSFPEEVDEKQEKQADFNYQITSSFNSFDTQNHILYNTHQISSLNIPAFIKPKQLAHIFPLRIHTLRLNLDHFKAKRIFKFGLSPIITEYLTLTCEKNLLNLSITSEHLDCKSKLPLELKFKSPKNNEQCDNFFLTLDKIIKNITDFSILEDWREKITH